jgi:hypothetical protein
MANELTNIGEEWAVENGLNGATVTVTVFNNSTDALSESDDLSAITTEPAGGSFARQSSAVATLQIGSDFGFDNDAQLSFDVSDSSQTVDHAAFIVNFTSDTVAGDGAATDHLVGYAALSQSRDLSQIDTLNIPAGDLELTLT